MMSTTLPVDSLVPLDLFDFELNFLEFPGFRTHDPFGGITMATCVLVPAGDAVLSSPESPWNKKPCVHESMAERLLQSASTVIMELDYKDALLIGYKRPDLSEVIPWIRFEAQNMMEPPWQTEMASIKQDENIRYIAVMFLWF